MIQAAHWLVITDVIAVFYEGARPHLMIVSVFLIYYFLPFSLSSLHLNFLAV